MLIPNKSTWVAFVTGAVLRIGWALVHPHALIWDEEFYFAQTTQLALGQPISVSIWPPGWPAIVAPLFRLFGAQAQVGVWLNVALSIGILVGVTMLAQQMFGPAYRTSAAWCVALTPSFIVVNALFMYEVWLQLLLVIAMLYALRSNQTRVTWLIIGLCAGLAGLMRPFWLALPTLAGLIYWARFRCLPNLKQGVLAQAVAIFVVLPWVWQQSVLAQRFVPVTLNSGMNLWIGNHPGANGTYADPPTTFWEPTNDIRATREAIAYIRAQPIQALAVLPAKIWYLFNQEHPVNILFARTRYTVPPEMISIFRVILDSSYYITLIGALIQSILFERQKRRSALCLWWLVAFNVIAHLPFFGVPRFNWPVRFVSIIYFAYACQALWSRWQNRYELKRDIVCAAAAPSVLAVAPGIASTFELSTAGSPDGVVRQHKRD